MHLAAQLARAADNICAALAATLAALKADEAFNQTKEAVLSSSTTPDALCLMLVRVHWRRVHCIHPDSSLGLGDAKGGSLGGVHEILGGRKVGLCERQSRVTISAWSPCFYTPVRQVVIIDAAAPRPCARCAGTKNSSRKAKTRLSTPLTHGTGGHSGPGD